MLNLQPDQFGGHASSYLITRPVAKSETFVKQCIVVERTDKQFVLRRLELDNFIIPYSPTPVDVSTLTFDVKVIPIFNWNIYFTYNPIELKETWSAPTMQAEMLNAPMAQNDSTYMLAHAFELHNLFVGQNIWIGDTLMDVRNGANTVLPSAIGLPTVNQRIPANICSKFDGLIKIIQNSAQAINLVSPTLTAANVVAQLQAVYNSIPQAMVGQYGPNGLRFLFSTNTLKLIEQAYNITTTFKNFSYMEGINNLFLSYEMVPLAEMPDNTIIATYANADPLKSQFFFAVNDQSDFTNLEMAKTAPASDIWFCKGSCKAGVGTGWDDQIVCSTNLNYVNQ